MTFGGTTASTDRLVIVKNSPGTGITGTFAGLAENALVSDNGGTNNYHISYAYSDGGTNNNVVLKGLTATTITFTSTPPATVTYGDTLTYRVHVAAAVGTPTPGTAVKLRY